MPRRSIFAGNYISWINWATGTILARLLNIIFDHLLDIFAGSSGSQIINDDDLQVSSGIGGSPMICNTQ